MATATTTSVQLYGNPKLPSFTALVDQVESQFSNWNQYIDVVTSSPDAALLPFGIEPDNLEDCKRAWVEISPYNRDDDAVNVISEAATGEKFDLQAPELEERFEFLLLRLNMDIEILSNPFMETLANLNGDNPRELYGDEFEYMITPELVQSFCNHVIL